MNLYLCFFWYNVMFSDRYFQNVMLDHFMFYYLYKVIFIKLFCFQNYIYKYNGVNTKVLLLENNFLNIIFIYLFL